MTRLTKAARRLRLGATEAEKTIWSRLRNRQIEGAKFKRQFSLSGYIVDFACTDLRLLIEVDGGQHNPVADAERTTVLEAIGYRVIRFWNHDVAKNLDGVLEEIASEVRLIRGR